MEKQMKKDKLSEKTINNNTIMYQYGHFFLLLQKT